MVQTTPFIDRIFTWKGWANGRGNWDSSCRIRIFHDQEYAVIVASDLGRDSGTSITNCCEDLIPLVCQEYALDPSLVTWIENYEDRYDLVKLINGQPEWTHLHQGTLEQALAKLSLTY